MRLHGIIEAQSVGDASVLIRETQLAATILVWRKFIEIYGIGKSYLRTYRFETLREK